MSTQICLISLVLLLNASLCCESSVPLDYSSYSCTLYLDYDKQCQTFDFDECIWQQCTGWYYDGEDTYCVDYSTFSDKSWNYCTAICCDDSVTYPQNANSIQQCQDYLHQQLVRTLIIIFSILGGIAIIVVVVIIVCCCKTGKCTHLGSGCMGCLAAVFCCWCCRRRDSSLPLRENLRQIQMAKVSEPSEMGENPIQKKWNYSGVMNSKLKGYCSVCLQQGQSLALQCSHGYHKKCIIECMRRKSQCILCRSTQFNKVRVYCQKCFSSYFQTTLMQNMQKLLAEQFICGGCREASLYS